ncbi:MAG TPA: GNAT family N-acetyltransferase [Nocardioides sp.]|jgi:predicted acetyltransferase|nr:GNAT family N-acetyltransferase [Nocardioides sp.]
MAEKQRPDIRVERATDAERFLASDKLVWFDSPGTDPLDVQLRGVPEDQRFAADVVGSEVDPQTYAGIYAVRPMQLSVPDGEGHGRTVPVAGLTWVGVHPDHRRRGLLTAMLEHHFEQTRREGGHLSALHASEPGIYGRHGYGLASLELEVEVGRGSTFTAPHLEDEVAGITTRIGTVDDPGMGARRRDIDLDVMATNVGTIVGDPDFYDDLSHVTADEIRDSEPPRILIAVRDGRDIGYATFKRKHKWPNSRPAAEVNVSTFSGPPAARLALLRRLTDLDLSGTVTIYGVASTDPVLSWVQGPRALGGVKPFDSLWVRLVDLPEALSARGYEADCDVVVEVADEQAPWNAGRWRIRVKDGVGEATATDDEAEVTLPVAALGAAYLGVTNLAEMHRAGVIAEQRPGAVRELWHAFRTDVGPYAARGF